MSDLPKLKVKWWTLEAQEEEITSNFEEAKDIVFGNSRWLMAFVDGETVKTYDELLQLVEDKYKGKDILNITLLVPGIGGG